jgi:hypothetical protein
MGYIATPYHIPEATGRTPSAQHGGLPRDVEWVLRATLAGGENHVESCIRRPARAHLLKVAQTFRSPDLQNADGVVRDRRRRYRGDMVSMTLIAGYGAVAAQIRRPA